ncbi:MAG: hypothetical protein DME25_21135, partial [Verrucomicrobia bacterium]
ETAGLRKDGTEIPIEVSFSDLVLQGERRFVGFIRDITERKRAERELSENQEQFRVAREIQQRLFPKSAPASPGFDIAGASFPAEATGGDYFDYLPMLHHRLGVIVGDVTGHGVGPALLMAETRAYLRVLAGRREDVGEILTRANGILAEDVGAERFVTLFLGRLDPATRALVYASAGPDTQYAPAPQIILGRGDLVLLLTDGIEETPAPDGALFGLDRTLQVVRSHRAQPAQEIVQALYAEARAFADHAPQIDDITAIVIKVC